MEKQGEAREKVLSAKRGKMRGEESRCRSANCHPLSLANNPNFGLFGPPDGIAVFLIFCYYFSYLSHLLVTMITGDHQLPSIS